VSTGAESRELVDGVFPSQLEAHCLPPLPSRWDQTYKQLLCRGEDDGKPLSLKVAIVSPTAQAGTQLSGF